MLESAETGRAISDLYPEHPRIGLAVAVLLDRVLPAGYETDERISEGTGSRSHPPDHVLRASLHPADHRVHHHAGDHGSNSEVRPAPWLECSARPSGHPPGAPEGVRPEAGRSQPGNFRPHALQLPAVRAHPDGGCWEARVRR